MVMSSLVQTQENSCFEDSAGADKHHADGKHVVSMSYNLHHEQQASGFGDQSGSQHFPGAFQETELLSDITFHLRLLRLCNAHKCVIKYAGELFQGSKDGCRVRCFGLPKEGCKV